MGGFPNSLYHMFYIGCSQGFSTGQDFHLHTDMLGKVLLGTHTSPMMHQRLQVTWHELMFLNSGGTLFQQLLVSLCPGEWPVGACAPCTA